MLVILLIEIIVGFGFSFFLLVFGLGDGFFFGFGEGFLGGFGVGSRLGFGEGFFFGLGDGFFFGEEFRFFWGFGFVFVFEIILKIACKFFFFLDLFNNSFYISIICVLLYYVFC